MTHIIDGKAISASIKLEVKNKLLSMAGQVSLKPCLAVVLVGDDPASSIYVSSKAKACGEVGFATLSLIKPSTITQNELEALIADLNNNAPVGTTQALIEQGAAVFSAVHARLHDSQKRVLKVIARLNRWYLDEQRKNEMVEDLEVSKEDFERNSDIIPVSDPHIFAETQRYAQIQTLSQRAQANPDLYNRLAVEKRILKQIKLPDINEVLPDPADVKDMNPALENVAMTLGKPVGAFPMQDHLAHIQVHLDYFNDPLYGSSPIMAPTFIPGVIEHLKQHLTLWYLNHMDTYTSTALNRPFNVLKVEPIMREAQQLLAAAGQHVHQDSQQQFSQVQPIIQKMLQLIQQARQNQQPQDPGVQALVQTAMAETQRKTAADQADAQLKAQKQMDEKEMKGKQLEMDFIMNTEDNLSEERIKSAELSHDAARLQHEQVQTALEAQNLLQSQLGAPNV